MESVMTLLMIHCPHTGRPISTGVEVEEADLVQLPDVAKRANCVACGMTHTWWKREAWLAEYVGRAMTPPAAILCASPCEHS
jgi:hypothetical protein